MKTMLMYIELQTLVTLFLVTFFWALQARLQRHPLFRLWTLGWMCYAGFLLGGMLAMGLDDSHGFAKALLVTVAVLVGYLQIPLILFGAQSLSRNVPPKKLWIGLGMAFLAGGFFLAVGPLLSSHPSIRYSIRSTPRQLGFAAVYLYSSLLFLRHSTVRPSRLGSILTAASCSLGGSIQMIFAVDGLRRLWQAATGTLAAISASQPIRMAWLNLDIAWECGLALGMTLLLLEDYQAANRALQASEEKFSMAFRASPDMISISRLSDGKEIEVNDSFLALSGYSREEVLGRTAQDLNMWVRPEDRVLFLAMLRQTNQVRDLEVPYRRRDGAFGTGLVSAEVIGIAGVPSLLTVTRDISVRKREEDALRWIARGTSSLNRSAFFAELVQHLATALQMRYCFVTECVDAEKARVRSLAFWDGKQVQTGFEYDVKGTPCEMVAQGRTCHYPEGLQELFPNDKALVEFNMVGYVGVPLLDSTGAVIGHLAILDDKAIPEAVAHSTILQIFAARAGAELEREHDEHAMRVSEANYRDLFENANDMIYTYDLNGVLTSLNKAGERISGYPRQEAIGINVIEVIAPEHREKARNMLMEKRRGVTHPTHEVEILNKKGMRVALEVSTRVIYRDSRPLAIQGIARDVSERRSLEDQLRQAQKMEAIGQLAGGIAHDFNNLLMVIRGYSDMLLHRMAADHPDYRLVERIGSAGERATALTRQLLAGGQCARRYATRRAADHRDRKHSSGWPTGHDSPGHASR
ncbi:MAG: PAS domain S-box protein [Acidobacteria bacterium]|nr:PAS domain S-box protein [Acidobacteriota bacterium]